MYRKMMGLALERRIGRASEEVKAAKGKRLREVTAKSLQAGAKPVPNATKMDDNHTVLPELREAEMLLYRIRYFTAGAVIGSKAFVNDAFAAARERFSAKRKDGARAMKGAAAAAKGQLWSMRDMRT